MSPSVDDLAGAQAKFVLFVASLLQRADVVAMPEFAGLLGVFAETVGETDPAEGRILTTWAEVVRSARSD
jgi:hypothetical protein